MNITIGSGGNYSSLHNYLSSNINLSSDTDVIIISDIIDLDYQDPNAEIALNGYKLNINLNNNTIITSSGYLFNNSSTTASSACQGTLSISGGNFYAYNTYDSSYMLNIRMSNGSYGTDLNIKLNNILLSDHLTNNTVSDIYIQQITHLPSTSIEVFNIRTINKTNGNSIFVYNGASLTSTQLIGSIENCAFYNSCNTPAIAFTVYNDPRIDIKNVVVYSLSGWSFLENDYGTISDNIVIENCADSDGSLLIGSNTVTGIITSDFISIDPTSLDCLKIDQTSKLFKSGSDSISTFNTMDIDNNSRPDLAGLVSIGVFEPVTYMYETVIKSDYITLTGPKSIRFSKNRKLNLTNFLPSMYNSGDVKQFLYVFEDYLNTLFSGSDGLQPIKSDLDISASYIQSMSTSAWSRDDHYDLNTSAIPSDGSVANQIKLEFYSQDDKISVIEKIYRLPENSNPDLIDIDFIQLLASNLGYKINMYRNEAGGFTNDFGVLNDTTTSGADVENYLRYFTSNIPNWVSIKTTRSSVEVLLRSYGLAGDVAPFYTNNYEKTDLGGNWIIDFVNDLTTVPNDYYPTSHFGVAIDIDINNINITSDAVSRLASLRAIESIRPANAVFRGLVGTVNRSYSFGASCQVKVQKYIRVE